MYVFVCVCVCVCLCVCVCVSVCIHTYVYAYIQTYRLDTTDGRTRPGQSIRHTLPPSNSNNTVCRCFVFPGDADAATRTD